MVTLSYTVKVSWWDTFVTSTSSNILVKIWLKRLYNIRRLMIFRNGDLDLHFQGQLMYTFVISTSRIIFVKIWLKSAVFYLRFNDICK